MGPTSFKRRVGDLVDETRSASARPWRTADVVASGGFSLVELLVALAVSTLVTAGVFAMLDPATGAFSMEPDAADVVQRGRTIVDAVLRDVASAGGAPMIASVASRRRQAAAVFPYRLGRRSPDLPGIVDTSRLAFWGVDPTGPQAPLASPLASASGSTSIAFGPGCHDGVPTCGFDVGMTVAALSHSGIVDLYSITGISGATVMLQHNQADAARVYPPGQTILVAVRLATYFFRRDSLTGIGQLRRYDGDNGADTPVTDHVESLSFELWGDADPPQPAQGQQSATYGPAPPPLTAQWTAYPPGENCAFARAATGAVVPRLASLGGGDMVPLQASLLTDGPWCPDALSPIRYDADLLRVRQIVVSIRAEAASDALRGPIGPLFARSGTARAFRWVPDRRLRLVVSPSGLDGGI